MRNIALYLHTHSVMVTHANGKFLTLLCFFKLYTNQEGNKLLTYKYKPTSHAYDISLIPMPSRAKYFFHSCEKNYEDREAWVRGVLEYTIKHQCLLCSTLYAGLPVSDVGVTVGSEQSYAAIRSSFSCEETTFCTTICIGELPPNQP